MGFYGLSSIGHDLLHMGYNKLAFLFDSWLISSETWIIMHHFIYHKNPCTDKDTINIQLYSELHYLFIGLFTKKINKKLTIKNQKY